MNNPILDCNLTYVLLSKSEFNDADTSALEKQIDKMVYVLFGLTDEKIGVVEGKR